MYPESLAAQPAAFIRNTAPNAMVYVEEIVPNKGDAGYLTAFWIYLGSLSYYYNLQMLSNSVNCASIDNDSYVVWSGPPVCSNWKNVFNVTAPSGIPSYIIGPESANEAWIISNVYYVN